MSRQVTPRVLLSFLLLWQLVAGAFVHAHGVPARNMQHLTTDVDMTSVRTDDQEQHCADHASMAAESTTLDASLDMPVNMHVPVAPDTDSNAQTPDSQSGCCQSAFCQCPCVQALALSLSIPHVVAALPDALLAPTATAPLLHAGISGLFRPPI